MPCACACICHAACEIRPPGVYHVLPEQPRCSPPSAAACEPWRRSSALGLQILSMPERTRCTHQDLVPAETSEPTCSMQSSASSSKSCPDAPATQMVPACKTSGCSPYHVGLQPSVRTADPAGQPCAQVGAIRRDRVEPAQLPARDRISTCTSICTSTCTCATSAIRAARGEQQRRVHREEHEHVVADVEHRGEREHP